MELTTVKCTESSKGGYIVKLQGKSGNKTAMFGTTVASSQSTYYVKLAEEVAVGITEDVDLDLFDIVEREFTFTDDEDNEVIAMLKWLHEKKG